MLSISIPAQVQTFVETQSAAAGFPTVSDYIYDLIVREQARLDSDGVDLTDPVALMQLPLAERRRILSIQADFMVEYYNQSSDWREFTAGDLIEY